MRTKRNERTKLKNNYSECNLIKSVQFKHENEMNYMRYTNNRTRIHTQMHSGKHALARTHCQLLDSSARRPSNTLSNACTCVEKTIKSSSSIYIHTHTHTHVHSYKRTDTTLLCTQRICSAASPSSMSTVRRLTPPPSYSSIHTLRRFLRQ